MLNLWQTFLIWPSDVDNAPSAVGTSGCFQALLIEACVPSLCIKALRRHSPPKSYSAGSTKKALRTLGSLGVRWTSRLLAVADTGVLPYQSSQRYAQSRG